MGKSKGAGEGEGGNLSLVEVFSFFTVVETDLVVLLLQSTVLIELVSKGAKRKNSMEDFTVYCVNNQLKEGSRSHFFWQIYILESMHLKLLLCY